MQLSLYKEPDEEEQHWNTLKLPFGIVVKNPRRIAHVTSHKIKLLLHYFLYTRGVIQECNNNVYCSG